MLHQNAIKTLNVHLLKNELLNPNVFPATISELKFV